MNSEEIKAETREKNENMMRKNKKDPMQRFDGTKKTEK